MTIEDYELILLVEKGISDTAIKKIGNSDEKAARFYEGQIWGLKIALDLLKKLEHDVTLKEVKEFCTKRKEEADVDEDPCDYCPMAEKYSCSDGISFMQCGQIADILPCDWDIDAIQKHMKEAQQ